MPSTGRMSDTHGSTTQMTALSRRSIMFHCETFQSEVLAPISPKTISDFVLELYNRGSVSPKCCYRQQQWKPRRFASSCPLCWLRISPTLDTKCSTSAKTKKRSIDNQVRINAATSHKLHEDRKQGAACYRNENSYAPNTQKKTSCSCFYTNLLRCSPTSHGYPQLSVAAAKILQYSLPISDTRTLTIIERAVSQSYLVADSIKYIRIYL